MSRSATPWGAAASLFTTGRLMFEGAACGLAVDRMKTYAQVTRALNALLPPVVGWELGEEGLACQRLSDVRARRLRLHLGKPA